MMRTFLFLASVFLLWSCGGQSAFDQLVEQDNTFDVAILGGTVIDGSGEVGVLADLLIRNDEIVFVGEVDQNRISSELTIDASGKVITPGFIDAHSHGNPLTKVSFESFLATGVTTMVLGQDGGHPSLNIDGQRNKVVPWMDSLDRVDLELNVAMLAGHDSLRRLAGIPNETPPTDQQLTLLTSALDDALNVGCFGISTGLEYVPGMYADKRELEALAKVIGDHEAIMMSHMRNEDDDAIESSLQELLDLGAFCKVHASHLKVVYGKGEARGREVLNIINEAQQKGLAASADVYPYIASYTGIGILFPSWCKTRDQFEKVAKTRKAELEEYLLNRVIKRNGPESTLFGSGKYAGKTLAQVAEEENRSYVDVLMDIGPQGASGAYFIMDQELQDVFITDPEVMIASDGSPTMLHPRGHGTQARILEKYVAQQNAISLERAIYKMSGLPARTIGIQDRGLIKTGMKADILVFDPSKVKEKATFVDPYQFSEGFDHVIVNGKLVRKEGQLLLANAGKLLRSKSGQ